MPSNEPTAELPATNYLNELGVRWVGTEADAVRQLIRSHRTLREKFAEALRKLWPAICTRGKEREDAK